MLGQLNLSELCYSELEALLSEEQSKKFDEETRKAILEEYYKHSPDEDNLDPPVPVFIQEKMMAVVGNKYVPYEKAQIIFQENLVARETRKLNAMRGDFLKKISLPVESTLSVDTKLCQKCGASLQLSQAGSNYCSKKCWLKKSTTV